MSPRIGPWLLVLVAPLLGILRVITTPGGASMYLVNIYLCSISETVTEIDTGYQPSDCNRVCKACRPELILTLGTCRRSYEAVTRKLDDTLLNYQSCTSQLSVHTLACSP